MATAAATAAAAAAAAPSRSPVFTFGVIADVQYADIPDGASFDRSELRYYRPSLVHAGRAAAAWAAAGATFAVNLGDAIDGANARLPQPQGAEALAAVLSTLSPPTAPIPLYHTLGNHELLNFPRARACELLAPPAGAALLRPPPGPRPGAAAAAAAASDRLYYAVDPAPGWRLVVLDAYDIAFHAHHGGPAPAPEHDEAVALLRANNPNPSAYGGGPGNFFAGLEGAGAANRWVPFNGAFGAAQLAWLADTLADAAAAGRSVVIFSHVLLHDGAVRNGPPDARGGGDVHKCLAWNYEEARALLAAAGCVVAVFSGHLHDGAYGVDAAGVHHVTLESPLTHVEGAHGVVRLFADRLELEGFGAVASRTFARRRRRLEGSNCGGGGGDGEG